MLNLYAKTHQKMTQRPIAACLSLKGMSVHEIHDDIVATLGPDAVSYSSVTRYLGETRFPPSKPEPHPADVQIDLDDSDQAILAALEVSLCIGCLISSVAQRAMREAAPHAHGMSKVRQL
jgi:hypothetical protein